MKKLGKILLAIAIIYTAGVAVCLLFVAVGVDLEAVGKFFTTHPIVFGVLIVLLYPVVNGWLKKHT
jgi:hypothetical protein